MRIRSASLWPVAASSLALATAIVASCDAETHVELLEECDVPGEPCSQTLICSAEHRCVPPSTVVTDAGSDGDAPHEGGFVELPEGGLPELLDGACATWEATSEPLPTSLMLVVDVSGSMNEPAPGGGTRWEVTRAALREALAVLPATTEVGMLLFPNRRTEPSHTVLPSSACVDIDDMVPIAPLGTVSSAQREALDDALRRANVDEGTPTHDAYVVARAELERNAPAGNRHLLLITDGQPTLALGCVGSGYSHDPVAEGPIIEEIAQTRAAGTRTFVIGSPGSEQTSRVGEDARPWLSRAASAGGTDKGDCSHAGPTFCHFDMVDEPDFSTALGTALAEIAGQIVPCDYPLPATDGGDVIDLDSVNVVWSPGDGTDTLFLRNDSPGCNEGWRYTNDQGRIELCPNSCDRVQTGSGDLTLIFGCATEALLY